MTTNQADRPSQARKPRRRHKVPDLRILALADAHLLPSDVQDAFDRWRIECARDAVLHAVRRRMNRDLMLDLFLERLEAADDEAGIFEGIYALAEAVDVNRRKLGIHSSYIILIMASRLNPYGFLALSRAFSAPPSAVLNAANELWRLVKAAGIDPFALLCKLKDDALLVALNAYYAVAGNPHD